MLLKYVFLLLLIMMNVYGSDANISSKFFDPNTVTVENGMLSEVNSDLNHQKLIDNDELPDASEENGNHNHHNLKKNESKIIIDEHGNTIYLSKDDEPIDIEAYKEPDDFNASKTNYLELYKKISNAEHEVEISLIEEDREIYEQKLRNLKMAEELNLRVEDMKQYTAGALQEGEKSQSYFSQDINNLEKKLSDGYELSNEEEDELAATKYYKEGYGFIPKNEDGEGVKKTLQEGNVGALSRAYAEIDTLIDFYKSRIGTPLVKCQISRELIPSFYCPIAGLDGLKYPTNINSTDLRKVNIEQAKKECDKNCVTPSGFYPTIEERMIPDVHADINSNSNLEAFPNFNQALSAIEFNGNEIVPLKDINFSIEFSKPEFKPGTQEEMTDKEWDNIINEHQPVIKFSFWYESLDGFEEQNSTVPIYSNKSIYNLKPLLVHSQLQTFSFPIFKVAKKYKIIFYQPFFKYQSSSGKMEEYDTKIVIKDINGEYTSSSFHYCSIYQMVPNPRLCKDRTKVKQLNLTGVPNDVLMSFPDGINQPGQEIYICADSESKIGPEPVWGAFYTAESAKKACISRSDCIPTYNHSFSPGSDPSVFYKSVIDCVDDPDNLNCSKALCESLFPSEHDTVINEYQPFTKVVITEDKQKSRVENVYSISNSVRTEEPRPRINFDEVFLNNPDYEEIFSDEEKDEAYLYMIENLRYNRSKYRVNEESPQSLGYDSIGLPANGVLALIKPKSFDYNSATDLNVYSIMRIESNFKPHAGMWIVDGMSIGAEHEREDVNSTEPYVKRIKDVTYLIKTGTNIEDWSIFRKIQNSEFYIGTVSFVWNDETMGLDRVETERWSSVLPYIVDKFETYTNGNWVVLDENSDASYFAETKFPINQNKFSFILTEDYKLVSQIQGVLFGDQSIINNGLNFSRNYSVAADLDLSESFILSFNAEGYEENWDKMSYVDNVEYYLLYDSDNKSYLELIEEIEGDNWQSNRLRASESEWGVYSHKNPTAFIKGDIKYDGEINNHIKFLIKGKPNDMTIGVDWEPTRIEKGQKVYKFSFLFDDPEYTPFEINGN